MLLIDIYFGFPEDPPQVILFGIELRPCA